MLDYRLSNEISGADVYKILKENRFAGKPIGFSSDKDSIKLFNKAGVENCVEKDTFSPEDSVRNIAKLISRKEKENPDQL